MTSGGATINDSYTHGSISTVPFGGVGDSGTGAYRGKASFDVFTHSRTVCEVPTWLERFLRVRYMPYQMSDLQRLQKINGASPDFDRSGQVVKGLGYWTGLLLGLGGESVTGKLARWLVVLAAGYAYYVKRGI